MEERNAIIKSASLTRDDHGVLSAWLDLDYGGSGQGFGGYVLYLPKGCKYHSLWGLAGHFIYRILQIADVEKWDQLPGKTIRVRQDNSAVYAIGHIVKDDWFCPKEDFQGVEFSNVVAKKENLADSKWQSITEKLAEYLEKESDCKNSNKAGSWAEDWLRKAKMELGYE